MSSDVNGLLSRVLHGTVTVSGSGSNMNKKQILTIICVTVLLSSYLLLLPLSRTEQGYAQSSWLASWTYRKSHVIQKATGAGVGYQIPMTIYKNAVPSTSLTPWYDMSPPWTPVSGSVSLHGFDVAHITDAVQCNITVDGAVRTYLAYDTDPPSGYRGSAGRVYLYYSNSLNSTWIAYSGNPIIGPSSYYYSTCSVVLVNGTFHLFVGDGNRRITRWTSTNAISFTQAETVLTVSSGLNAFNDPFIWLNPNDSRWYLFWSTGDGTNVYLYARSSTSITNLSLASDVLVMQSATGGGSGHGYPTVMYRDGKYWLLTENNPGGVSAWGVYAFYSISVTSGYTQCSNNPILNNIDACPRVLIADDGVTCYLFYNEYSGSTWFQKAIQVYATISTGAVSTNGHCRDDFGDIRFTASDGVTPLNYWMENSFSGDNATFWVQIAGDLSSDNQVIYVYYGNSSATTTSNGYNTFSFFEDFENLRIDNGSVYTTGTGIVSVSSAHAYGGYSLAVSKPSAVGNAAAVSMQMSTTSLTQFKFGLKFYQQGPISTTDGYHLAAFEASQNAQNPMWAGAHMSHFDSGPTIEYYSNGWRRTAGQTTQDSWTSLLIKHKTSTFTLTMQGNVIGTYNNLNGNGVLAVHLGCQEDTFGGLEFGYFDDLFLAKFVDPEPTNGAWGSEEATQLAPMTFGSISANTTVAGSSVQLSCPVNSGANVSFYVYSWNNTGSWTNQTAEPFTNFINSSAAYATLLGTWNTVAGNTVLVKIFANDTYNNWNASPQYNFVITPASASRLVFTAGAPQSLTAGQLSSQITVQRQDQYGNPCATESVIVGLSSSSGGATFYSDNGATPATSVTVNDGSSTVSFWYKDTAAGSPSLTVSTSGLSPDITTFSITSGSLDNFAITVVPSPQTAGAAFDITITARDEYGNTVTSYYGSNTLSDLTGTISPTNTSMFSGGIWTGSVTITKTYDSDTISTLGSGKSGTTNPFDVHLGAFDHFTLSDYPASTTVGQRFNITVTAWDAFGNLLTGYAGQVYFTSSDAQAVLPYTSGSRYTFVSGDNGSHTFTAFELKTVPSQTITVTDGVKSATTNWIAVTLVSPFSIISNSTISELAFNSTSQVLEFTVSGPSGTTGSANVTIAKTLISDISPLKVYLDGNETNYTVDDLDYAWLIHLTYPHSTHKLLIATKSLAQPPEDLDPNTVLLGTAVIASLLAASLMTWKRLRTKKLTRKANLTTAHVASAS